jgi:AraC family transcriptional regulator of adaptative response/methylated-DNA-[protein]-cysteine methyltransferase
MVAIADDHVLYLLEFFDSRGLERKIERLQQTVKLGIIPGTTCIIDLIEKELHQYFQAKLMQFTTPLFCHGTPFQKNVWECLQKIPYGETRSYADIAQAIKKPTAIRAVANAIGANQLAIIIPCHRVINSNGELGGYAGGLTRKIGLIQHEDQGR